MLGALRITNYILIDSLDREFPKGLIVISGPTGAGKSIIAGALAILGGAKADASLIRAGEESCVIEGEFTLLGNDVREFCKENDLECDADSIVLTRKFSRSGRARAFVNDEPVSMPVFEKLGRMLVDIHSQHDTLLLQDSKYQMRVLDAFAGNAALLEAVRNAWKALSQCNSLIEQLRESAQRAGEQQDYNEALYRQLKEANLQENEIAELESEQYSLAHSEQIKELLAACLNLLDTRSDAVQGVNSSLQQIERTLEKLSEYIPETAQLKERLTQARIEIKDISESLSDKDSRLDCSPERLEWVDNRIALLHELLKRHNCEDEAQLIERRNELERLVGGAESFQIQLEDALKQQKILSKEYADAAKALGESRKKAAPAFSAAVEKNLAAMELEKAKFTAGFSETSPSANGCESVEFMFNATPGTAPAPVSKCASGGEMSRIMLSLKKVMSDYMDMPLIVFDEIDTGVGGSVADKMGSVICDMGSKIQIFAITHLPQVAAKGTAHYIVEKTVDGDSTTSTLRPLDRDQRVMEVARMLSGSSLSEEAIANARSLMR